MKDDLTYSSVTKIGGFVFAMTTENEILALCLLILVVSASAATMSPEEITMVSRAKRFVCASLLGIAALLGFVLTGYQPIYYLSAFVIAFVMAFAPEIMKTVLSNRLGGLK